MANITANNQPTFSWKDVSTWNGDAITQVLRAFNNWRDDFLIELTTLLLMIGFVIGTIDVLTSGGLSQVSFVNYAWAVVQAIAIDGLFFAVWGKIRRLEWTLKLAFNNIMLIVVGLLLAVVAALVNNILGYEELNHVATLAEVMSKLGVDATIFSYVRSTLVVLVSILVALFARNHGPSIKQLLATIASHVDEIEGLRAIRDALTKERNSHAERATVAEREGHELRATVKTLQEEKATIAQSMQATIDRLMEEKDQLREETFREKEGLRDEIATLQNDLRTARTRARNREIAKATPTAMTATNSQNGQAIADNHSQFAKATKAGYIARDNGETMAIANEEGDTIIATGSHRDRIKEAMLRAMAQGEDIGYGAIAQAANAGYSTVKKYAKEIQEEIARESTGEMSIVVMEESKEN